MLLSVIGALRMVGVARDLRSARNDLEAAAALLRQGEIEGASQRLDAARSSLLSANSSLHSGPELDVLRIFPVARQNIDAMRTSVGVTLELASGGGRLVDVAAPLQDSSGQLQVPLQRGAIPLDTVAMATEALNRLEGSLPARGDRPSSGVLLPPVRDLVDRVYDEIDEQHPRISSLSRGLTLLHEMAGGNGDRRYLIAVANTAEMRGSGGMYLSYGVLESFNGDFRITAFGEIDDLFLDTGVDPEAIGVPDDTRARWGPELTRLWRAVNSVPDLGQVGPWAATMYHAATTQRVDGVLQIDAAGLAALLQGVGPVQVEGLGEVNAANAVDLTLNEAYTLFPDRDQRQEVLADVAEVTFRRLVDGTYPSLRPLGEAIARAAAQRHIEMWSPHPAAAGPLGFFDADGSLPDPSRADHAFLTVQNYSRNKLDYYVDTAVRLTGSRLDDEAGRLTLEVTIANRAPDSGLPEYVVGDPDETGSNVDAGVYYGVASLYVPVGVNLERSEGSTAREPRLTTEAGRSVIGWEVLLAPGESSTVTLEVSLLPPPDGRYRLELVPFPRVRPTVWEVDVETGGGHIQRTGPLTEPEAHRAGR
ncbi:MAG: DUF4012 domain-containing protein [Acidimicrobiales bacterium]